MKCRANTTITIRPRLTKAETTATLRSLTQPPIIQATSATAIAVAIPVTQAIFGIGQRLATFLDTRIRKHHARCPFAEAIASVPLPALISRFVHRTLPRSGSPEEQYRAV